VRIGKAFESLLEGLTPRQVPGRHVVNFATMLAKIYLNYDRSNADIIVSDLSSTIEVLSNHSQSLPDGLVQLVDMIKMSSERIEHNLAMSGPTAQLHSGIQQAREFDDPHGLLEKTEFLLRDWVNMYHSPSAGKDSTKAFTIFVQQMNMHGLLKTDDLITRFFRMSTQMCVDLCYRALAEQNNNPTLVRAKCFHTLDAFVRLIALLVKHSGDQQNTITKVNLLNKVLGIVAGVLLIDHDVRGTEFQQVPYHRIFIMLFLELNAPDQILETINFQVLTAYCNMLSILRPAKAAPGFAYPWAPRSCRRAASFPPARTTPALRLPRLAVPVLPRAAVAARLLRRLQPPRDTGPNGLGPRQPQPDVPLGPAVLAGPGLRLRCPPR